MVRVTAKKFRELVKGTSQQERADRQQAQASAERTDRADGGNAERVEAEQHGGDQAQDPSDSGHAGAVPEGAAGQTVFGACTCQPRPATADGCRCEMRGLIDQLLVIAYHCDPAIAAQRLRSLITQAPAILTIVQADLMCRLAAGWTGTPDEFCKRYGYTRQRLHQMGVRWRG